MSFLFIGATGNRAGHSLITWAIARRLVEKGLSVGFIKPFGGHPTKIEGLWTDQDAFLFKKVLNLEEPYDRLCPYLLSEETYTGKIPEEIQEDIITLARELATGKDVLLVMGARHIFFDDTSQPVTDISLINELKADFILVNRYQKTSTSIYSILSICSLLKDKIKGIIINRVPAEKLEEIRSKLIPSLARHGVPIAAALPEDPPLSFRSLREIREMLNGELLWSEENMGQAVGGMTVGSADLKSELMLFKRAYNKIVLLKPFSLDGEIEEPPAHRSVAGIILTGGRNPAPQLIEAAKKAEVPLMLVKDDTFSVLERLEKGSASLSPRDEVKVRHFTELMDRDGALDRLLQSVGFIRS